MTTALDKFRSLVQEEQELDNEALEALEPVLSGDLRKTIEEQLPDVDELFEGSEIQGLKPLLKAASTARQNLLKALDTVEAKTKAVANKIQKEIDDDE